MRYVIVHYTSASYPVNQGVVYIQIHLYGTYYN